MKLEIDYEKCIGCGLCFYLYSKVFSIDDEGYSKIKNVKIEKEDLNKIKKVAAKCPTLAIKVEEKDYNSSK